MPKIPSYDEVTTNNSTDLFVCEQTTNNEWKTKKTTLQKIADAIFGAKTDNNLPHYTGTPTAGSTAEAIGNCAINTNDSPLFKTKSTGSFTITVPANSYYSISGTDFGMVISGYTRVAMVGLANNSLYVECVSFDLRATGSGNALTFINRSSSNQNATINITVLYARDDIVVAL